MRRKHILIVDDEASICSFVAAGLEECGFRTTIARDGYQAIRAVEELTPDLVVLDIVMPGLNGVSVCDEIRKWSNVPIIMLSIKVGPKIKIHCLRMGVDDYLEKPFSIDELLARVDAVLRRAKSANLPSPKPRFVSGPLEIDYAQRRVIVSEKEIPLTPTEFNVLWELASHAGMVLTHTMLLKSLWGPEYGDEKEYVREYIARLRRKVQAKLPNTRMITTITGVGYRFELDHQPEELATVA